MTDSGATRTQRAERGNRAGLAGWRRVPLLGLLPLALWQAFFYGVPLLFIVLSSFWRMTNYRLTPDWTLANYAQILGETMYRQAYFASLQLSVTVVAITILIAYPLAYTIAYVVPKRHRLMLLIAVIAPFWTNYLVRAYSWQLILSDNGVLNYLLLYLGLVEQPIRILYTSLATGIGLVHFLVPLMTLNLYSTLENIEGNLIEAAGDLGAGRLRTFFEVILPLSAPGLASGGTFIFVLAFADFVSPAVLGGQAQRMFPQLVVDAIQWMVNYPLAAAFALIMVLTILAVAGVFMRLVRVDRGVA
jgi:spermidine/putrescine transport system permease protein